MQVVTIAVLFLIPIVVAPGILFYYDVTPKIALLLTGTGLTVLCAAFQLDSFRGRRGTRLSRWFGAAVGLFCVCTLVAAARSSQADLAWNGSAWRHFGAIPQIAAILTAGLIALWAGNRQERMLLIFLSVCAAGVLAAAYGIAQFFGWDPLLPKAGYEAGEGIFQIVRPPGTLGHGDYFAAFLLWPVFMGLALAYGGETAKRAPWRALGALCAALSCFALVLTGSRGAMVGLFGGGLAAAVYLRVPWRKPVRLLAAGLLAVAVLFFSPGGTRLRARAHWVTEEPLGGARLPLWRDTLKMAAASPLRGWGPDNFAAEFPQFQSEELAQAFPDFYHESPHNLWLDVLAGQGVPALLAFAGIVVTALAAGVRACRNRPGWHTFVWGGLVAVLLAHQFVVFSAANALFFYLGAALLSVSGPERGSAASESRRGSRSWAALALAAGFAGMLCWSAFRLVETDWALGKARRSLEAGDRTGAVRAYQALPRNSGGITADLYFSRAFARVAADAPNALTKIYFSQMAATAAVLATQSAEQKQNAWYNFAMIAASREDAGAVETGLRRAIAASPHWYKPHWALARLLSARGRAAEASTEAKLAARLNGRSAEVSSSLAGIIGSAGVGP